MNLRGDILYALRTLRRSPAFAAISIASLALGIGANTALFTLTEAVLLRWLPVQNPQELVVFARNPAQPSTTCSYPDYRFIRDNSQSYSGVIASSGGRAISFGVPGQPNASQVVALQFVSGNYFEVLGVPPAFGRLFNEADNVNEGAHPYAVLSHGFWQRTFGADTGVVGKDVVLNGTRFQVIGVAREGFTGSRVGDSPDVFVPIVMFRTFTPVASQWNTRSMWWLTVMARLKPEVSLEQASSEYAVLWKRILDDDPNKPPAWLRRTFDLENRTLLLPGNRGFSSFRNNASKPLQILSITVALILVIACANVANLLLVRGLGRRREVAIRLAVGAARRRLVTQMLTESVVLSLLGGIAGTVVAWAGVRVLLGFMPAGTFPIMLDLSPNFAVVGFAFGVSVLSGILFGLAPALRASKPDLIPSLKSDSSTGTGGRGSRWDLRRTLVAVQVALSVVLLVGAGLFVRTLTNLKNLDAGLARESLLLSRTNLDQLGYQPQKQRTIDSGVRDRVQRIPGVRSAALAAIAPLAGSRWNNRLMVEGYQWGPDERPIVDFNAVSPRFFETLGVPIVLGRDFAESDNLASLPDRPTTPAAPGAASDEQPDPPGPPRVAIVNEAFVRKFFGTRSPLGKRICEGDKWTSAKTYEIVGVVRDAKYFDLREAVEPMFYRPIWREGGGTGGILAVRTAGDASKLVDKVRSAIRETDSAAVLVEAKTMEDNLNRNLAGERVVANLGGFFGLVALVLAAIGLYGVMAETVSRRTKEIGIRMALGAEGRAVLWLVLRDAVAMVVIGVVVGGTAALFVTRYAETMLFGIKRQDPVTLAVCAVLLLGVTGVACFMPARRAARMDPMGALREQ